MTKENRSSGNYRFSSIRSETTFIRKLVDATASVYIRLKIDTIILSDSE